MESLISSVVFAGGVNVPSQGWVIFGGEGRNVSFAQKLANVAATWQPGPELFDPKNDSLQCIVQVILFI
jgi:hypothetical protein